MTSNKEHVPTSNRFSARHIWNAHLKGLRNRRFDADDIPPSAVDRLARVVLYGIPIGLGLVAFWQGATLVAVDGLMAAAGLLAGALFMAFTQVAAWRERYTERMDRWEDAERPQRYSLDEAVAHILMATYACLALVVITMVGANFAEDDGHLTGAFSALSIAVGSYLVLLLLIILPKLYTSYAVTHRVSKDISGLSH